MQSSFTALCVAWPPAESASSPWQGYGTGSLDRDAADLCLLCQHLRHHHAVEGVVLLGHSTGCQDAVRYMQRYGPAESASSGSDSHTCAQSTDEAPELLATVLQAPVSSAFPPVIYS